MGWLMRLMLIMYKDCNHHQITSLGIKITKLRILSRGKNSRNTSPNESLYEIGSQHLQGLQLPPNNLFGNRDSPNIGSYRDIRRTNIKNTVENEFVNKTRAQHLQGLQQP